MAGNTQEFVTIIRLNSEEAKNNLADLKKRLTNLPLLEIKLYQLRLILTL